ncbi:MAG: hypothetical protein O7D95_01880 [Betaproteobacteria bacterium]|nr:hypothetical protein [Betaproteobacteria bacterium]
MDINQKYAGYTHIALKIDFLFSLKAFLAERNIEIAGHFSFKDMNAISILDPDRNVIEFDEYLGDDPSFCLMSPGDEIGVYKSHP